MSGDRGSRPRSTHRAASGGVVSLGLHRSPLATLCTVRIGRVARPALRECGRDEGARQSVRPVAPGRHVAAGWVGSTSSDQSDQSAPRPPAQEQRISTAPPVSAPPSPPQTTMAGEAPGGMRGRGGEGGQRQGGTDWTSGGVRAGGARDGSGGSGRNSTASWVGCQHYKWDFRSLFGAPWQAHRQCRCKRRARARDTCLPLVELAAPSARKRSL